MSAPRKRARGLQALDANIANLSIRSAQTAQDHRAAATQVGSTPLFLAFSGLKCIFAAGSNARGGPNGKKGSAQARPKRKATNDKARVLDDEDDGEDDDDEEDEEEEEHGQPARKKRRPAIEGRARILKDIADVEGAIKRLQTTFAKDLTKLQQTVASLASQIREMED